MKLFCRNCDCAMEAPSGPVLHCSQCGAEYNLADPADSFTIRTKEGGLRDGLHFNDVVESLQKRVFHGEDQVAGGDGPWMPITESFFGNHLPKVKKNRAGIMWFSFFTLSLMVNGLLVALMYWQKLRIDDLVKKVTGG